MVLGSFFETFRSQIVGTAPPENAHPIFPRPDGFCTNPWSPLPPELLVQGSFWPGFGPCPMTSPHNAMCDGCRTSLPPNLSSVHLLFLVHRGVLPTLDVCQLHGGASAANFCVFLEQTPPLLLRTGNSPGISGRIPHTVVQPLFFPLVLGYPPFFQVCNFSHASSLLPLEA